MGLKEKIRFWKLKSKAEKGDAEAQYQLAKCYDEGNGTKKDLYKAFDWFEKAANNGHLGSRCAVGMCYEYGDGVQKNPSKAFMHYSIAAEDRSGKGKFYLASCYFSGIGTSINLPRAFKLFVKAAELGFEDADKFLNAVYQRTNIAGDLFHGKPLPSNPREALILLANAAEQGDDYAQRILDLIKVS